MDWHRLSDIMENTRRSTEVFREIGELRKAVPSPMQNQHMIEMTLAQLLMSGSPELVTFYEAIRDEVKEVVEQGKGIVPQENFRLLTIFFHPAHAWKLLDAMQNEHGATIVAEPHLSPWAEGEIDPSEPLESLARKAFALYETGPLGGYYLDRFVRQAIDYKADGALYWAHIGCRQTCACIRIIKDALMERAGIPTLILDNDLADPTYVSGEQMKSKLEEFFELLEERK